MFDLRRAFVMMLVFCVVVLIKVVIDEKRHELDTLGRGPEPATAGRMDSWVDEIIKGHISSSAMGHFLLVVDSNSNNIYHNTVPY